MIVGATGDPVCLTEVVGEEVGDDILRRAWYEVGSAVASGRDGGPSVKEEGVVIRAGVSLGRVKAAEYMSEFLYFVRYSNGLT